MASNEEIRHKCKVEACVFTRCGLDQLLIKLNCFHVKMFSIVGINENLKL